MLRDRLGTRKRGLDGRQTRRQQVRFGVVIIGMGNLHFGNKLVAVAGIQPPLHQRQRCSHFSDA